MPLPVVSRERASTAGEPGLDRGSAEGEQQVSSGMPFRIATVRSFQFAPPAEQQVVHRGRADEWFCGTGQSWRIHHERSRLGTAEATVETDQLLERAALV